MNKKPKPKVTAAASVPAGSVTGTRLSGWKLWSFRVVAVAGIPALGFALLEGTLRISGVGHPVSFLVSAERNGQPVFEPNNRFGWRFFGSELARRPYPFSIAQSKPRDAIRIFVLGESAAKGDPDPHFGFARVLEATLSLRHPGVPFEVVNTAMTAINSHAILPIARDCAKAGGDVWVIYMGNNEVVGPFGAGTVFGPQTPPLPLIRGALAVRATRTGQLLEAVRQWLHEPAAVPSDWGGMEMFLNQQVGADDARMNGVYHHFERNLADIIRAGRRSGAGIVVSTVAVNLRDCAPFASAHRADLAAADKARWDDLFQSGCQAQAAGNLAEAADQFRQAARWDDRHAEMRFRQGQCALAAGQQAEALAHFRAARDLDTLRFRCDTRLNEITRKAVTGGEPGGVRLADAESRFAERSPQGLPGAEFFYEHVHLTFAGNCLLARIVAEQVEDLLGSRLPGRPGGEVAWPTTEACARRLGWSDWARLAGWKGVLPRLNRPPFTGQFDHAEQMQRVGRVLAELAGAAQPAGLRQALLACQTALAMSPNDAALVGQLAVLEQASGNVPGAARAAERALELLPNDAEGWSQSGLILARQRQFADAAAAFQRAVELDAQDVVARENLAQSLAALGRREEARREFSRVLAKRPRLGLTWLHFGQLEEQAGRQEKAAECYRKALAHPGANLAGLIELAGFCQSRGWFEAAATNYMAASKLDPANAQLCVGAGQNLSALGRVAEAANYSAAAVRLAPTFAEARLLHGLVLGRQGFTREAVEQFREALRLKPALLDARLNLGIALLDQNPAEALACFEEVLRQNPAHATAQKYAQRVRAKVAGPRP